MVGWDPAPRLDGMDSMLVIVVFAPATHADDVRAALAGAGAGRVGEYSACSFSAPGTGRFLPGAGSRAFIGEPGRAEEVAEQRIECVCPASAARAAIEAMLATHPYEEPAYHCYSALSLDDLP